MRPFVMETKARLKQKTVRQKKVWYGLEWASCSSSYLWESSIYDEIEMFETT